MKRAAEAAVASFPFSNWENVPDVVVPLILELLEPRECIQLSAASRGCRAIASRCVFCGRVHFHHSMPEDVYSAIISHLGMTFACVVNSCRHQAGRVAAVPALHLGYGGCRASPRCQTAQWTDVHPLQVSLREDLAQARFEETSRNCFDKGRQST
jgi:hypothetical protein